MKFQNILTSLKIDIKIQASSLSIQQKTKIMDFVNFSYYKWKYFVPIFGVFWFLLDQNNLLKRVEYDFFSKYLYWISNILFLFLVFILLISFLINIVVFWQQILIYLAIRLVLLKHKLIV